MQSFAVILAILSALTTTAVTTPVEDLNDVAGLHDGESICPYLMREYSIYECCCSSDNQDIGNWIEKELVSNHCNALSSDR
jgi:hypothetical protein